MLRRISWAAIVSAALMVAAMPVQAQTGSDWNTSRLQATRAELQAALTNFEKAAHDDGYSSRVRESAKFEAALIKQRLEFGDFQPGDEVRLIVDKEPTLSDTATVTQDLTVILATGDTLPLKGVLRSELEGKFREAILKVVRQPVVHAESYMRVSVTGDVGKQGYYTVAAASQLNDVLMVAGGPGASAKLTDIRVERGTKTIWDGEPLQAAITEGRTLDQMSLRAGDRIVVPAPQQKGLNAGGFLGTLRAVRGLIVAVPLVFALIKAL